MILFSFHSEPLFILKFACIFITKKCYWHKLTEISTALVVSLYSTSKVLPCHRTELPLQLYPALLRHLALRDRVEVLAKVEAFGVAIYLPLQLLAHP